MDALIATSFDRYARYLYTHRLRTGLLGPAPLRILDVGDPYGTLGLLFPHDDTTSLDLFAQGSPVAERHHHIIGSGMRLPFPDGSFDLVTAHDVLEHVPPGDRTRFVTELLRVSAGPVVVAAPFADPRTELCERLVNAFYVAHLGSSLEPLDEHAEHGLPDLGSIVDFLQERQLDHVVYSDGWLFHWLAVMMLKAHYVSLGAANLDRATDAAFNRLLRDRDRRPPHYRRALILRPPAGTEDVLGAPVEQPEAAAADGEELEALAVELVHALPPEQDPAAPGSALRTWLDDARGRGGDIGFLAESLAEVLDAAAAALADAPEGEREARFPTITALVLRRADASSLDAVLELLRSIEVIDTVVECDAATAGDAMAIALALEAVDTEAILIVDPEVDLDATTIHRVIDAYGSGRPCVGYHRAPTRVSSARASVHTDGDDALYVARELLLVDRDLYRGLGGLDGRFRGGLDEVDFGWRVNTLGFKVTTVGPAPWITSEPDGLASDVAVLWCWLKNLELGTLQRVLPVELLAMIGGAHRQGSIDWWEAIESLLEARAEVAKVRAVADEALLERFGNLRLVGTSDPAALRAQALVADALASSVTPRGPARVAFVTDERGAARAHALAALAATEAEVTVAVEGAEADHLLFGAQGVAQLQKQIEHAAVLVGPPSALSRHLDRLSSWTGVLVVDLAAVPDDAGHDALMRRADVVLFDSEAQRERWRSCPALHRRHASGAAHESFLMVATTPNDPEVGPVMTRGAAIVVDLIDHPDPSAAAPAIDAAVEAACGAPVVVAVAEGTPIASVTSAHVDVDVAVGAVDRRDALARAAVVVRPDGESARADARSAAFGADALAAGVPLVTTPADPAGALVTRSGAGVVASDAAAVATAVERALRHDDMAAAWRVAAASASIGFKPGGRPSPFLDVIRRPWKWQFAHAGGGVPLHATPEVASLLAAQEAAVVRSVTTALEHEHEARLRAALQAGAAETARLTLRLEGVESELADTRAVVGRLRAHPAVRLLLAIRRRLRGS